MCAAVITILGRGRGGRGGRLEAKAHAFRRGNLWEKRRGKKNKDNGERRAILLSFDRR